MPAFLDAYEFLRRAAGRARVRDRRAPAAKLTALRSAADMSASVAEFLDFIYARSKLGPNFPGVVEVSDIPAVESLSALMKRGNSLPRAPGHVV